MTPNNFNSLKSKSLVYFFATLSIIILFAPLYHYLNKFEWNLTGPLYFEESWKQRFVNAEIDTSGIYWHQNGYDGMQYYAIALKWANPNKLMKVLDYPSFRYQRIFFPFLAALFSGVNKNFLPTVMILINVFSGILLVWVTTRLVTYFKGPPIAILLLIFASAATLSIARVLTDTLALMLFLSFLLLVSQNAGLKLIFFTGLALILTREVYAVLIVGLIFFKWINKEKSVSLTLAGIIVFWVGWKIFLLYLFSEEAPLPGGPFLTFIPFGGWVDRIHNVLNSDLPLLRIMGEICSILAYLFIALIVISKAIKNPVKLLSDQTFLLLVIAVLIMAAMGSHIIIEPWGYNRTLAFVPLLFGLYGLEKNQPGYLFLAGATFPFTLFIPV